MEKYFLVGYHIWVRGKKERRADYVKAESKREAEQKIITKHELTQANIFKTFEVDEKSAAFINALDGQPQVYAIRAESIKLFGAKKQSNFAQNKLNGRKVVSTK